MDHFIEKYVHDQFGFDIKPRANDLAKIRLYQRINHVYIILDDDPTGTQTVHDIHVYTQWDVDTLVKVLNENERMAFILTNSRALPEAEAIELSEEIGANLKAAAAKTSKDYTIVSRGDSTLRGHFPAEVEGLLESTEQAEAIKLVVPAFFPGGRYTFQDIHYVKEGETLTPVAETPFADDKSFGFKNSNLRGWVEEKYDKFGKEVKIESISIEELRTQPLELIRHKIETLSPGSTCLINALTDSDLEQLVLATQLSMKPLFFRTAASLVPLLIGQEQKELLSSEDFQSNHTTGNLIIVGSYVPKTTSQLQYLKDHADLNEIEVNVDLLFQNSASSYVSKLSLDVQNLLQQGEDVLLFTSRSLRFGSNQKENLAIGKTVSHALVQVVKQLQIKPKSIIAKGGITSSDIATKALGIKKAKVLGQILPGVPVWETTESINYIVFPGNVGDETALYQAYKKL